MILSEKHAECGVWVPERLVKPAAEHHMGDIRFIIKQLHSGFQLAGRARRLSAQPIF
jgi:hypothetical protein